MSKNSSSGFPRRAVLLCGTNSGKRLLNLLWSTGHQTAQKEGKTEHAVAMRTGVHDFLFHESFNVFLHLIGAVFSSRIEGNGFFAVRAFGHDVFSFRWI